MPTSVPLPPPTLATAFLVLLVAIGLVGLVRYWRAVELQLTAVDARLTMFVALAYGLMAAVAFYALAETAR